MITVTANAKINLALDVLGKRKDGYHEVNYAEYWSCGYDLDGTKALWY